MREDIEDGWADLEDGARDADAENSQPSSQVERLPSTSPTEVEYLETPVQPDETNEPGIYRGHLAKIYNSFRTFKLRELTDDGNYSTAVSRASTEEQLAEVAENMVNNLKASNTMPTALSSAFGSINSSYDVPESGGSSHHSKEMHERRMDALTKIQHNFSKDFGGDTVLTLWSPELQKVIFESKTRSMKNPNQDLPQVINSSRGTAILGVTVRTGNQSIGGSQNAGSTSGAPTALINNTFSGDSMRIGGRGPQRPVNHKQLRDDAEREYQLRVRDAQRQSEKESTWAFKVPQVQVLLHN